MNSQEELTKALEVLLKEVDNLTALGIIDLDIDEEWNEKALSNALDQARQVLTKGEKV